MLKTLATLFWWKINQIFFHLPAIVEIAPGVKIICYPDTSYGSFIVYARWPEFAELNFICGYLQKDDIFIDVGAHIGDFSLLAASKVGAGKVIACEPTPEIFEQLVSNIKLNTFESSIHPVQKATAHKEGIAKFAIERASEVNHLQMGRSVGKTIKVITTKVDKIVSRFSLKKVTLLKIDVEGFELEVLLGAKNSLKNGKIEVILFEVNPQSSEIHTKVQEIEKMLKLFKYDFYEFANNGTLLAVPHLYVPRKTNNFVAVASEQKVKKRFKKWLKK